MALTGRRLSHYEIIEEISRGGMGVVYRALDVNLAREVALKVPPRGAPVPPPSPHPELWLAAASAHIKAGRDADAATLLERLQAGQERIFRMDSYVRSFFLLAQIYERRGDAPAARAQYERFLHFWRGGDLEPGWVAEAEKKVAAQ